MTENKIEATRIAENKMVATRMAKTGKTTKPKNALVLGGGGSRGAYEAGVWQALRDLDYPIDIVTGTSVGAINGAMVAQDKLNLVIELWHEMETHMIFDFPPSLHIKDSSWADKSPKDDLLISLSNMPVEEARAYANDIFHKGGADTTGLQKILKDYIDEDAVRRSSVDYGLVTVELPLLKPHYLYKENIPKGKLADFILASASCFPAVKSHEIDGTKYIDGAYADNMPVGMALKKGATAVVAVNLDAFGVIRKEEIAEGDYLTLIRSPWDLGNFLIFDGEKAARLIRLGYLECLKAFNVFEGEFYSFVKGEFGRKTLACADMAAKIFDLDPCHIYRRTRLNQLLYDEITLSKDALNREAFAGLKDFLNIRDFAPTAEVLKKRLKKDLTMISKKLNRKTLTLTIANNIKEKGEDLNPYLTKAARRLFEEEVKAARYLLKEGLV